MRFAPGCSLALVVALTGCLADDPDAGDDPVADPDVDLPTSTATSEIIATPANMGRYCSMTWPTGGWAFAWYNNMTNDPCAYIAGASTLGVVQRAGLFSRFQMNNITMRCDGHLHVARGVGDAQFVNTFNAGIGKTNCIFTIAPMELAIFGRPYDAAVAATPGTGFDFARGYTLDTLNEFGDPAGGVAATKMDWKGRDRSAGGWIDNHDGWDLGMPTGTKIYAVADGVVDAARYRDTTNVCSAPTDKMQGEVFITHTISGGAPSTYKSTRYDEKYLTAYFHFRKSGITVSAGQAVAKGTLIGYAGTTGCSSGPHLHITVSKLNNTSGYRNFPLVINTDFSLGMDQNSANNYLTAIEPHGFSPPIGFDPWSYRAYPNGALSTRLWAEGQAPPTGDW
jgi:murein DD-endopeptidase MepM/ murein hydrolase activator NlpD